MKDYSFTAEEQIILRDALREYKHALPSPPPQSERGAKIKRQTQALLDQFANDVRLGR